MLRLCVLVANQPDAQAAVVQMIADGCAVPVVEDLVAWLEAHCGDVLADLRALLDGDKEVAALAGVGAPAILARLQQEFFQG
jgi:hypothetical protein